MPRDRLLTWLLRAIGGVELLAAPFVFVPLAWMSAVHDRFLGLGPLPHGPIVEYMARSLSAVYAVHGAVVFLLSFDLPRYRPVIRLVGGLHVALGLCVAGADWSAGLPLPWILGEGAVVVASGGLILLLARGAVGPPGR